jgi:hypothetical protein
MKNLESKVLVHCVQQKNHSTEISKHSTNRGSNSMGYGRQHLKKMQSCWNENKSIQICESLTYNLLISSTLAKIFHFCWSLTWNKDEKWKKKLIKNSQMSTWNIPIINIIAASMKKKYQHTVFKIEWLATKPYCICIWCITSATIFKINKHTFYVPTPDYVFPSFLYT